MGRIRRRLHDEQVRVYTPEEIVAYAEARGLDVSADVRFRASRKR